jgi:type II secretory pathway pseudopilin PulG
VNANRRWCHRVHNLDARERGFGVIEIVISMLLLGLMMMSFIPVLINSQKGSGANTTMATATQIVNQQLEGVRSVRSSSLTPPSCLDVTKFLQATLAPVIDPRGVTLQPQWNPSACPASYPGVARVGISVMSTGSAIPIASAVTLVFVASAT